MEHHVKGFVTQCVGASWHQRLKLAATVVCVFAFRSAIADWNDVPTGSMRPTIVEGDRIFVNKLAYDLKVPFTRARIAWWDDPQRGDIVLLYSPADGKRLVKRVIGTPGDTVAMVRGRLIINGVAAEYDTTDLGYRELLEGEVVVNEHLIDVDHPITLMPRRPGPRWFGPIVVPQAHYLVMGDNRDNSADSRVFGFVDRAAIVGKTTAIVCSFDRSRCLLPRPERFFTRLI